MNLENSTAHGKLGTWGCHKKTANDGEACGMSGKCNRLKLMQSESHSLLELSGVTPGLLLSFQSPVFLFFTPVTNLSFYGWILSITAIALGENEACSAITGATGYGP